MERSIFTIKPVLHGWQLADQDAVDQWYLNQVAAIRAADCMSLQRYTETGKPTGVKVQMTCGDWVMVRMHG